MMQLVEQHVIDQADPRFAVIDAAAFKAKNLYNAANYLVRQAFIFEHRYGGYAELFHLLKHHEAYTALPRKVSNDILRQLDKNWRALFAACEAYRDHPSKFAGRPKVPRYKDKTKGRCLLIYDRQAISRRALARGILAPSGLAIEVQTAHRQVKQARIVPRIGFFVVEIVYEQQEAAPSGNPALYASVDIGVDNLAALTSNKAGFVPRLVNGRPIKSTNQFYNKRRADLQEALGHPGTTARMERLTTKRTRRINHYLHTASKAIIALLVQEGIGTLVVGKNVGWKQEAELGRVNNQHFVGLPHARFIAMLEYKAKLAGICFVLQEESYTSKASALDGDAIPTYDPKQESRYVFSGKRIKRGLYQAKDGRTLNADVNGSANILRKALPNAFDADGIEAVRAVRPVWVTFAWSVQPRALAAAGAIPTNH
ncbi:MAG TPA: transposase [Ktedonobacterales bacterium]|nr:transposase [Ktedonobacterales bacterium]